MDGAPEFRFELDRIEDFKELSYNLNKLTLKEFWSFLRTDSHILIFKISATLDDVPKMQITLKIDPKLNVSLWIEDVSLEVEMFWKLLGFNLNEGLRYSMLLELVKFLDSNPMIVGNRKKRWDLDAIEVKKVIESERIYCRVCFNKCSSDIYEMNQNVIDFLEGFSEANFTSSDNYSKRFCKKCADFVEEIEKFREFVYENENFLTKLIDSKDLNEEDDQMVLIRAEPEDEEHLQEEWIDKEEVVNNELELTEKIQIEDVETEYIGYSCKQCSKSYQLKSTLNKHVYRVHTAATEMCNICGKGPYNPYKLQCHMHFHELKHECGSCKKRFAHPAHLHAHFKRIHSGFRTSHICEKCNQDFITSRKLKDHLTEIHGFFEVKDLVECNFCKRKYEQKSSLINHFRKGCDQDPDNVRLFKLIRSSTD